MPFDLARAARLLHARHDDALGFRFALLDLLFAAGCSVREQAVALEHGDAVCVRTAGPAAPVGDAPLWLVAVDVDPPGPGGRGTWRDDLAGLGGPDVAVGWLAALHAVLQGHSQRPWELVFVRGPALGTAGWVQALTDAAPARADVVLLAPCARAGGADRDVDLARMDLRRPRNIWRFPACDHTNAVAIDCAPGTGLARLRGWIARSPGAAWTLHDLRVSPGPRDHLTGVLRSSLALQPDEAGCTARALESAERLLFPVNDALSAHQQLAHLLPAPWGDALATPLALESLPDGLRTHMLVAGGADDSDLPDRIGTLALSWSAGPLGRAARADAVRVAVAGDEVLGLAPAGIERPHSVWRTPAATVDGELAGLQRAVGAAVGRALA
ncbi:MAG: hypothetical protein EXR79_07345 [Myxococcales bacterium]|nr:hypothetical protein [Myxococcales bacterium]